MLSSMLLAPDISVFSASMISTLEQHRLLVEWNNTATDFARNKCVHELFEAVVRQHPHNKALFTDNISLNYEVLNSKQSITLLSRDSHIPFTNGSLSMKYVWAYNLLHGCPQ